MRYFLKKIYKLPDEIIDNIIKYLNECYYCKKKIIKNVFCHKCLIKWEENLYFNYIKKTLD